MTLHGTGPKMDIGIAGEGRAGGDPVRRLEQWHKAHDPAPSDQPPRYLSIPEDNSLPELSTRTRTKPVAPGLPLGSRYSATILLKKKIETDPAALERRERLRIAKQRKKRKKR